MSERTYSQVNTGISVREASFLSPAQFDALLNSSDAEARANLLQGTAYALEADQLRQVQVVEQALMKHLLAEYDWVYQVAPNPAVVGPLCPQVHLSQSQGLFERASNGAGFELPIIGCRSLFLSSS